MGAARNRGGGGVRLYHADVEVGSVERMLRETPGVLDCSVSDEGIAVVVHPEVDPRMLEVRVQAALAELGDRRPLLVVGGMSTAGGAYPPARAATRPTVRPGMRRPGLPRARSSMPVLGFVVLVVAAITLVPLAGRSSSRGGRSAGGPTTAAASPSGAAAPSAADVLGPAGERRSFGPLAVVDEVLPAALAPASRRSGSAAGGVRAAGRSVGVALASPSTPPAAVPAQDASATAASADVAAPSPAERGRSTASGQEGDEVGPPRDKRSKHDDVAAASFGDDPDRTTSAKGKAGKGGKPDDSGKAGKSGKGGNSGNGGKPGKADKPDKAKGRGGR